MVDIFPVHSLDRSLVRWEEHLQTLTPWENHLGVWFKREDYFAPLGYGGPNGSKMRQLIWYVNRYREGKTHVVTGASIQSPQLSMSAIVGAHYGMPAMEVVYSKPETVLRHPNPSIAAGFGARFHYASGPYNPILQAKVATLAQRESALLVHYGISVPTEYPEQDLIDFHSAGALQAENLPKEVRRLVIPAGSCNSLLSILLGLSQDTKNLEEVYTIGIGPDKREWLKRRAQRMGLDLKRLDVRWKHVSLHDAGYGKYGDKYTGESWDGIDFHPVYEGRMWRWLRTFAPLEQDDSVGFWIVGSAAQEAVVRPFYTHKAEAR